jgi:beta-N-acetylhexosaminidase
VLRRRLGFEGVIFSDDLSMHAAETAGSMTERARQALTSGCDMVLVCNDPAGATQVLDEMPDTDDVASHMRLVRMHGTHPLDREKLQRSPQWSTAVRQVLSYDHESNLELDV